MKSGLIIYVVGEEPPNWNAESEMLNIKKSAEVDLVEIITVQTGHFDVLDAWWSLLTKGMKHITCRIGEFSQAGNVTITSRELRLCG